MCDIDGLTPLMIAAEKGHTGVVNLLVENGAKLDIQDKDDKTFFHICAEYNQADIIKVVLVISDQVFLSFIIKVYF